MRIRALYTGLFVVTDHHYGIMVSMKEWPGLRWCSQQEIRQIFLWEWWVLCHPRKHCPHHNTVTTSLYSSSCVSGCHNINLSIRIRSSVWHNRKCDSSDQAFFHSCVVQLRCSLSHCKRRWRHRAVCTGTARKAATRAHTQNDSCAEINDTLILSGIMCRWRETEKTPSRLFSIYTPLSISIPNICA